MEENCLSRFSLFARNYAHWLRKIRLIRKIERNICINIMPCLVFVLYTRRTKNPTYSLIVSSNFFTDRKLFQTRPTHAKYWSSFFCDCIRRPHTSTKCDRKPSDIFYFVFVICGCVFWLGFFWGILGADVYEIFSSFSALSRSGGTPSDLFEILINLRNYTRNI